MFELKFGYLYEAKYFFDFNQAEKIAVAKSFN